MTKIADVLYTSASTRSATQITAEIAAAILAANAGATATEINLLDVSDQTESVIAGGAVSIAKRTSQINATGGAGAITLAAPSAAMLGQVKVIEYTGGGTNAITLALTNVVGGSAASSASFNADNETLVLVAGTNKWIVIGEAGVTLS